MAIVTALLLLSGCNGALFLPKGEKLYNGAKVKVKKKEKDWDTDGLAAALPRAIVLPRKNPQILWLRPRVGIYNVFHRPNKEGGFGNWVASKLGTPPVLYSDGIIGTHHEALKQVAADYGFFEASVTTKKKGLWRKKKLKHTVHLLDPAKTIDSLVFPQDSGEVEHRLLQLKSTSLLVPGTNYQLGNLALERQRLADSLRNEGWFYLSPDHLFFEADTLLSDSTVTLRLRFKEDVTAVEKRRYRIEKIVIRPDYGSRSGSTEEREVVVIDSCRTFSFRELNLKKKIILDNIRFQCGEYFSNEKYRETLFRLLNLQYFKFVSVRFDTSPTSDSLLVARVLLTPAVPQKVETSFSGIYSPNYYFGVQSGVTWLHRNLLGSGEQLKIAWEGSLLQVNRDSAGLFTSDVLVQVTLPQKIPGLRMRQRNALTATRFSLEHQLYFWNFDIGDTTKLGVGLHSLNATGGFIWKKNRQGTLTHEFNPLGVSLKFSTFSDRKTKDDILADIPTDTTNLNLLFATYLEFRPSYAFNYDNRLGKARDLSTYFRQKFTLRANGYQLPADIEAAADLGRPVNLITESNFSQYLNLSNSTVLAWRLGVSAALPLTGESYLYLFDLYTIGGASSVRAFPPRSIGPGGTEGTDEEAFSSVFGIATHNGNIHLLANLELRQRFGKSWELATFFDTGNVWLVEAPTAEQEAGVFAFDRFYQELASGAGVGIRYNLGLFVLRLDLAIPISKPYRPTGSRLIGQPGFGTTGLRANFAFGYPF